MLSNLLGGSGGSCRSNFVGTSFTVYDNGCKPPVTNIDALREEVTIINYVSSMHLLYYMVI